MAAVGDGDGERVGHILGEGSYGKVYKVQRLESPVYHQATKNKNTVVPGQTRRQSSKTKETFVIKEL